MAGTMVFQSAWAVLGIAFAKNVARAASTFNIGMTIGLAGGPFLGGALYSCFGYIGPFFLFGGFTFLYAFINIIFNIDKGLPSRSSLSNHNQSTSESSSSLSVKHACSNIKPVLGLVVYFFSLACLCFFEPILADKLSETFGYSSDQVAYFYARFTLASFVGNSIMIVLNWQNYSWFMASLGFGLSGIGCVLLAPQGFILETETTPALLTAGLVCLGIGCEILLNTSSALTLNSLNQQYPARETEVGKLFAQVRINVASSSFLIAPFAASLVTELTSYEVTCTASGLLLLILFVFYVLFSIIAQPNKKREKVFKEECTLTEPLLEKD